MDETNLFGSHRGGGARAPTSRVKENSGTVSADAGSHAPSTDASRAQHLGTQVSFAAAGRTPPTDAHNSVHASEHPLAWRCCARGTGMQGTSRRRRRGSMATLENGRRSALATARSPTKKASSRRGPGPWGDGPRLRTRRSPPCRTRASKETSTNHTATENARRGWRRRRRSRRRLCALPNHEGLLLLCSAPCPFVVFSLAVRCRRRATLLLRAAAEHRLGYPN